MQQCVSDPINGLSGAVILVCLCLHALQLSPEYYVQCYYSIKSCCQNDFCVQLAVMQSSLIRLGAYKLYNCVYD